jgi:protein-L-isoaspartate(D-aspartate) O-methyltransferase
MILMTMMIKKRFVFYGLASFVAVTGIACGNATETADKGKPASPAPAVSAPAPTSAPAPAAEPAPEVPGPKAGAPAVSTRIAGEGTPPTDSKEAFVEWMAAHRHEDPKFLGQRWDRYTIMIANGDLLNDQTKRAFLMTPREEFVRKISLEHSYDHNFIDIGFGVTISGPHAVGRMTSVLDVKKGEKVLEVGTGSGYQSAILSQITDQVWTIEIIKPLAERTRGVYDGLIARGYEEYKNIHTKQADGYYGWEEAAPFDKIIVTCGIDHIPPSLLQQLKVGGVMVIPVGPPGAQHVLKVTKDPGDDGLPRIARSDIYNGKVVPFVPFTKLENGVIVGSHNK